MRLMGSREESNDGTNIRPVILESEDVAELPEEFKMSGLVQRTQPRRANRSLVKPKKYSKDGYLISFYVVYPFDNG